MEINPSTTDVASIIGPHIEVRNLGLIHYHEAEALQLETLERVRRGEINETLFVCSHNPVVTIGRRGDAGEISGWMGEVFVAARGGRATYHGPGQVIVYPIINLQTRGLGIREFIKLLESAIVETLRELGIESEGRSYLDATGVWVGEQKIASIGIAVRGWVSYHGLALNLNEDLLAFTGIKPCGFSSQVMTSVERVHGSEPSRADIEASLVRNLQNLIALR